MRRKTAVILGVSGAALALTASSAFTAGGLTLATGVSGFLGGSKEVSVTGTEISGITYNDVSGDATKVGSIDFLFSDHNADGKTPTIAFTLASGATAPSWTCTAVATVNDGSGNATSNSKSTCSKGSAAALTKSDLSKVNLTVA